MLIGASSRLTKLIFIRYKSAAETSEMYINTNLTQTILQLSENNDNMIVAPQLTVGALERMHLFVRNKM